MRNKKPMNSNYGHKRRFDGGHRQGGGHHNNHRSGGPRKNWPQLRDKYLAQARDAMASGDRVLAENFLQHADHCWRMMMEEGYRPRQPQVADQPEDASATPAASASGPASDEEVMPGSAHALPAFITTPYGQPQQQQPVPAQNWEERDAE